MAVAPTVAGGATAAAQSAGDQSATSQPSGGAFGHYTIVSLFGGPSIPKGPVPDVRLPASGAADPITASEPSGSAVYGPATVFGGKWPPDVDIAPPSGPTTVSTKGTPGPGGSVTSSVDIVLRDPADPKSPGGFGPEPPTQGDELHSTCTASESGSSGSVHFVHAVLATTTNADGSPTNEEAVPDDPPVNYTRTGELTNVGDHYRIVYNEQFVDPDGSITVNAVHMYMLGNIAVGEQIIGQVRCSVHGAAFAATPAAQAARATAPPTTAPAATSAAAAVTIAAKAAGSESAGWMIAGAGAVVAALGAAWFAASRRARGGDPATEPSPP